MIQLVRGNMAPLMFGGMILFMLIGYPAAFSLAATGLFFGFIGIELGLIISMVGKLPGLVVDIGLHVEVTVAT